METAVALDALMHKQPSEETNFGRSQISPDRLEVVITLPADGVEFVEGRGAQCAASLGTERQLKTT
jgi:hypothetical protein